MANLLSVIARKEREKFFWRLDAEWGKGLKRVTSHNDRSPDFRHVTRPPKLTQYRVDYREDRFSDWQNLWSTEWPELAHAYLGTLKAEGFKARVSSREPAMLSANQSACIADLVATFFAGCENQTVVKRAATPIKAKVYRSIRLMQGVKPAAVDLTDSLIPAPYRIDGDGRKVYLP